MTTRSWSSVNDTTSAAGYRTTFKELSDNLVLAGLTKVYSNCGDFSTLTYPATGVVSGIEVFAFGDALQGTAPIFVKLEYFYQNPVNFGSCFYVTVGNAHDGAGNLTGTSKTTRFASGAGSGSGSGAATAVPSYLCHGPGHLTIVFKYGWSQNTPFLHVCRYSDDDATPNANGFSVHVATGTSMSTIAHHTVQSVRTAATAITFASDNTGLHSMWPHGLTASSVTAAGNLQTQPCLIPTRQVQQEFSVCSYLNGEVAAGSTFTQTLKGSTSRTFLALGIGGGAGGLGAADARMAVIWE